MPISTATCPFCGLLCDDLAVEADGNGLRPVRNACERSRAAFASLGTPAAATSPARVGGTSTSAQAAIDAAADILRSARRPLIGGLAVDVFGMRAVMRLARRIGAVVDHAVSPVKYRNLHVLQEAGWITTTLAEVKNRSDLLVLIGDGWHARFPRFVERIIAPDTGLFGAPLTRRIILIDQSAAAAADALPSQCERLALGVPVATLPALFAMLNALAADRPVDPARMAAIDAGRLQRCVEWMRAARYGTVVWAASDLEIPHAELALQTLSRLLRTLNRSGRFTALPLAGSNGDLSANAVHTWQTGVAVPASHANRRIDFDPHRYAASAVLARREADCLLWISSLSAQLMPPAWDGPSIVLGRSDMQLAAEPRVFVPIATPGVDADGSMLRTDKVVSLYLRRLRQGTLLSLEQVVGAMLQKLA